MNSSCKTESIFPEIRDEAVSRQHNILLVNYYFGVMLYKLYNFPYIKIRFV